MTTFTNVKERDKPEDRQGAVYKIKCSDCQATYIGKTGRNLSTRLTGYKRATRNDDVNMFTLLNTFTDRRNIKSTGTVPHVLRILQTSINDSLSKARLLGQTSLNRSQQLLAPYKRLIDELKQN